MLIARLFTSFKENKYPFPGNAYQELVHPRVRGLRGQVATAAMLRSTGTDPAAGGGACNNATQRSY